MAVDYGAHVLTIYNGDFSTAAFSALGGGVLRALLKTFGQKVLNIPKRTSNPKA